jgi:hypothetical protein
MPIWREFFRCPGEDRVKVDKSADPQKRRLSRVRSDGLDLEGRSSAFAGAGHVVIRGWVPSGSSLAVFRPFRRPRTRAGRRRGGQGREAPGPTLARRDGGWLFSSVLIFSPQFVGYSRSLGSLRMEWHGLPLKRPEQRRRLTHLRRLRDRPLARRSPGGSRGCNRRSAALRPLRGIFRGGHG